MGSHGVETADVGEGAGSQTCEAGEPPAEDRSGKPTGRQVSCTHVTLLFAVSIGA